MIDVSFFIDNLDYPERILPQARTLENRIAHCAVTVNWKARFVLTIKPRKSMLLSQAPVSHFDTYDEILGWLCLWRAGTNARSKGHV
jgi:hypothetical protein